MRVTIPRTPFINPRTNDIDPAWRAVITDLAQWHVWGDGSPEGKEAAHVGTVYHNRLGGAGTSIYIKETESGASGGDTGWIAK